MGMLLSGNWRDEDNVIANGAYVRPNTTIQCSSISRCASEIAASTRRFWLIASASCPWSHRTMIIRNLKALQGILPIHLAHGPRLEGYALNGGSDWTIPGSDQRARHLHQLYTLHDPHFTGRVTVPVLWDSERQSIVSNESADIVRILDAVPGSGADFSLRPDNLAGRIDEANGWIHDGLNNAVYQAGFAQSQAAYDTAVATVFETLDTLDERLALSRFYFGNRLTEVDIRLFPTLVRFDAVYAILFKCCLRRLIDYEYLWGYARDLFHWHGVQGTVDFDQMRAASYLADAGGEHPVIAIAPDVDWLAPHERARLGDAFVTGRNGDLLGIDPATLDLTGQAE